MTPMGRQASRIYYDLHRFGLTLPKLVSRLRASDDLPKVLSISVPKSGTHLIQRILLFHPRMYRPLVPTLGPRNEHRWKTHESVTSRMRPGQVLSCHFEYSDVLHDLLIRDGVSPTFLYRDPRAVLISALHYIKENPALSAHNYLASLPNDRERIIALIKGVEDQGVYTMNQHFSRFLGWVEAEGVFAARFEDLVGARGGGSDEIQASTVASLFRWLNLYESDAQIAEICRESFGGATPTFREGSITGWQRDFDDELTAMFLETHGELLDRLGYAP